MHIAGKLAALTLISLVIAVSGCGPRPADETWNFLVYMDGDNNLEYFAIKDLNEMELVGSGANLRILVLFDRSPYYDQSNGNWTGTRLYLVDKDRHLDTDVIRSTLLADYGELDMSDPATLRDFLIYCQENYPADHTVLTLWNHGGGVWPRAVQTGGNSPASTGPVKGIAWDDTTGSGDWDCLTTDEVARALYEARTRQATGRKLDLINLDACNMQMLEIAYEWRDEADFLVGSEETVPGVGNDYGRILALLHDAPQPVSARDLAVRLVDSYHDYYEKTYYSTTYSALSLGAEFSDLVSSFASFAAILNGLADLTEIETAWTETTSFASPEDMDLYSFAREIERAAADPSVLSAAAGLKQALSNAVIRHAETGWHVGRAYGLSVLIPSAAVWPRYSGPDQYVLLKLSQDTDWDDFITRFVAFQTASSGE